MFTALESCSGLSSSVLSPFSKVMTAIGILLCYSATQPLFGANTFALKLGRTLESTIISRLS